jgi:REP element-mobilizing transposase RayT
MTNHVHLVYRSISGQKPKLLIGDLKRFSSQSIVKRIRENPRDPSLKVRIGEAKQKIIFVRFL